MVSAAIVVLIILAIALLLLFLSNNNRRSIDVRLTLAALGSAVEDMRPINETRMAARWKLGRALAQVERLPGGRGKNTSPEEKSFKGLLKALDLDKSVAMKAQRISKLPDAELDKAFAEARAAERLLHYGELIVRARPWWYQESRIANLFGHPAKLLSLRKWCDASHRSRAKSSPLS